MVSCPRRVCHVIISSCHFCILMFDCPCAQVCTCPVFTSLLSWLLRSSISSFLCCFYFLFEMDPAAAAAAIIWNSWIVAWWRRLRWSGTQQPALLLSRIVVIALIVIGTLFLFRQHATIKCLFFCFCPFLSIESVIGLFSGFCICCLFSCAKV